jgi:ketosteroid isomerase-like protein
MTGRGKGSGAPFEIDVAHLWTVRDGVVVRGHGYANRAEALEVVGLSE